MKKSEKIWMDGEFVKWDDAKVHVMTYALHYGASIFEGIRCYNTKKGSAVFRLEEHVKRLFESCKIYRMELNYNEEEIKEAILDTVRKNGLKSCYIRPLVFRGYGEMGVNPLNAPVHVMIAVWEWGSYLGDEALEKGIKVKTSSWNRMAPNTFPFLAKAGGNYLNSQLAKMEAILDGYDEAVMLDIDGYVAEGSGENIFLIKDGVFYTPPVYNTILRGITRDFVIKIAKKMGYPVKEERIPREMLYISDEIFFAGTAAEITPIREIDHYELEEHKITKEIQNKFFETIDKCDPKYMTNIV
ncbi:MAG: branched-chain amino acid transaminase [Methanomicrobia archaeon]|nr:branched-chain amino acid transaminase [Methanomicrobia archaeon]